MKKVLLVLVLVFVTVGAFAQLTNYAAVKDSMTDEVTQVYSVMSEDLSGQLVIIHPEDSKLVTVGVLSKTGLLVVVANTPVIHRIGKGIPKQNTWMPTANKGGVIAPAPIVSEFMNAFKDATDKWLAIRVLPEYSESETYTFSIIVVHNLLERHPFK